MCCKFKARRMFDQYKYYIVAAKRRSHSVRRGPASGCLLAGTRRRQEPTNGYAMYPPAGGYPPPVAGTRQRVPASETVNPLDRSILLAELRYIKQYTMNLAAVDTKHVE